MASNVDVLTRAHTALKAKARAKKNQIDSVVFDDDARVEFLTGFHKRKLQKKEAAKSKAKERERQQRLQARKEQRQALREKAQENARQIESALKQDVNESSDEETNKLPQSRKGKGKATQEFEDEEQLATVTIVEEFDPDTLRHMSSTAQNKPGSLSSASESRVDTRIDSQSRPPPKKAKVQPKRTPYETKAARKAARVKQHSRKLEKANLASRNARRKEGGKGGKGGQRSKK
ncbi:uncharacterized protein FOMMEDRAFT_86142 [Fomitiporia mediterranea MF3/22]|uniref:uncharacterized protein n=1 Tax=Fomitiporia mediterranea (strain MF3/22) TaxID=694068 RepID=UPI0004408188|nr:uncharacterized protein FOMMEDRAFT_86142 [Fomitiporia mediterranea MF3/22]EJD02979.1 hypothetical protein FOMMEDRAFT_86142 [Fomitiporia mediterranea MF3/22]